MDVIDYVRNTHNWSMIVKGTTDSSTNAIAYDVRGVLVEVSTRASGENQYNSYVILGIIFQCTTFCLRTIDKST